MIDFTTIQTNPIPPPVLELQKQNLFLLEKNKVLQNVFYGMVAAAALLLIIYLSNDAKTNENHKN
ncbi:MAG: hypothetical protein KAY50_08820 [Chitinophagaceae bacterium]|nr:hypothetical protein [Chitinophagaceae bacterium]